MRKKESKSKEDSIIKRLTFLICCHPQAEAEVQRLVICTYSGDVLISVPASKVISYNDVNKSV